MASWGAQSLAGRTKTRLAMEQDRLPSIKPQSSNSGALTAAPEKSALSAEVVAPIPVSLLHVNPLLGRQLRGTGKQSLLLHGFLFHHLQWGLREWNLLQISDSIPIATATRFAAKAKYKAISNKVLMVFKYRNARHSHCY